MLVINGVGTQMFFTPINTYLVDAMQKRSAEAIAVNNFFRYLFAAAASAFVLPMINGIGLGWTMTIGALCCWLALGLILVTMKFGEGWREAVARDLVRRGKEVPQAEDGGKALDGTIAGAGGAASTGVGAGGAGGGGAGVGEGAKEAGAGAVAAASSAGATVSVGTTTVAEDEKASVRGTADKKAADVDHDHDRSSRRASAGSSHHEERTHGEPTQLPAPIGRTRTRGNTLTGTAGLARERSRRGSAGSLPTVGELLQRTVSISGASVHGA